MMKISRRLIEAIYDRLFEEADFLLKKENPCGDFEFGICSGRIKKYPAEHLYKVEKDIEEGKRNTCCCCVRFSYNYNEYKECKYITRNGCTAQNLKCKTFLCDDVGSKSLHAQLKDLRRKIIYLGFSWDYYISKNTIIKKTLKYINNDDIHNERWKDLIERVDSGGGIEKIAPNSISHYILTNYDVI